MSMFEDSRFRWRETYFVLFDVKNRPTLKNAIKTLTAVNRRYEFTNQSEDEDGRIDSLSVISPNDFAALDICYSEGPEVVEQTEALVEEFKKLGFEGQPPVPWSQIKKYEGRFDVLHFEQVPEDEDDSGDEMLDPAALLVILEALAKLTGGVAVDPQSGTFLSE
jgi:hypothetical protein